jgi:2-desacetyl-2-hydroxyethyl bacteriochlorophyllide A dehydrogenase
MRAVRFHGAAEGLVVEEAPVRPPGPHEVLVRVAACGLCGSDVHFLEGMPVPGPVPVTFGHEPAGTVVAVGEDVGGEWAPGDAVAITITDGCGGCRTCRAGAPEACPQQRAPGLHLDGAFADYVTVPSSTLVRVPDGVSMAAAAVATDCVASPYHALACRGRLRAGEQVVVIGIGGLGSMAVMLARHMGAERIVAVDRSPAALERAVAAGADATVLVPEGAEATAASGELFGVTAGGAELVVECVGRPDTTALGGLALAAGGRLVLLGVGMAPPPIPYPQALFALSEYSVIGSFASHKEDLEEVLRLQASGAIDIESAISHRLALEEVPDGYERLRHHRGDPQRIVMVNG